jgi:hypothetical protein
MEKINRNKIWLLDFWIVIAITILDIILFSILTPFVKINDYFIDFIRFIFFCINLIIIFSYFIKSIIGGIYILKGIIRKELFLVDILFELIFSLPYAIILIIITCFYVRVYIGIVQDNIDPIIIYGVSFNIHKLWILGIINVFVNTFGIPFWFYLYKFSNNSIKIWMKNILSIVTHVFIIFLNIFLFFVLLLVID